MGRRRGPAGRLGHRFHTDTVHRRPGGREIRRPQPPGTSTDNRQREGTATSSSFGNL